MKLLATLWSASTLVFLAPASLEAVESGDTAAGRPIASGGRIELHPSDRFVSGPEAATLQQLAESHPVVPLYWTSAMKPALGIGSENVQRVLVFFADAGGLGMVRTRQPYDVAQIRAALAPEAAVQQIDGVDVIGSDAAPLAAAMLDDTTLLYGPQASVVEYLQQQPKPAEAVAEHLNGQVDDKLVMAIEIMPDYAERLAAMLESLDLAELATATRWRLTVDADEQLTLRLVAEFHGAEAAEAALPGFKDGLKRLNGFLAAAKDMMPPFLASQTAEYPGAARLELQMAEAIDVLASALPQAVLSRTDERVEAVVTVMTKQPVTTAALLMTLTPREAK